MLCDLTEGTTFLGCPMSFLTVPDLHFLPRHIYLSPKAGTVEACKVWPFPQGQEGKIICGGGQGPELGHGSVVGVPYVWEAVGCGD